MSALCCSNTETSSLCPLSQAQCRRARPFGHKHASAQQMISRTLHTFKWHVQRQCGSIMNYTQSPSSSSPLSSSTSCSSKLTWTPICLFALRQNKLCTTIQNSEPLDLSSTITCGQSDEMCVCVCTKKSSEVVQALTEGSQTNCSNLHTVCKA